MSPSGRARSSSCERCTTSGNTALRPYRLQVRAAFDLDAAAGCADYLAALGVGAVYCRRCCPRARFRPRLRRGRLRHGRRRAAAPTAGTVSSRPRAAAAWAWSSTSCPTTPASPMPHENPAWWDVLRTARSLRTRGGSTSTGPGSTAAPRARRRRSHLDELDRRGRRTALLRAPLPHRARNRPGARRVSRRRARAPALRARQLPPRRHRAELPSLLRGDDAGGAARRGRGGVRRDARGDRALGASRTASTGCASTIPTDWSTRAATSSGCVRSPAPGAWLTVEKILEPGESLPDDWPVDGTTGYDALAEVANLFVDPAGEARSTRCTADVTGDGARLRTTHVRKRQAHVAVRRSCAPR